MYAIRSYYADIQSYGIGSLPKQILNHRLSENAYLGQTFHFVLIEYPSVFNVQFLDIQVFLTHPVDGGLSYNFA